MSNTQKTNEQAPCCGSAGAVDITGCRMSLYPMSDDFVDIILGAVGKIDTSKVWSATDHLGTVYRGRQTQVVDCAGAAFLYAVRKGVHMAGEFTFSRGCPGDVDADRFLETDDTPCNGAARSLEPVLASSQISFYAFGVLEYMEHIRHVIELARQRGLQPRTAHYVTQLEGNAADLFAYFGEVLAYARMHLPHYVLQATVSVHSPTVKAQGVR